MNETDGATPDPSAYAAGEATTLIDVIDEFEAGGFRGQFDQREGAARCLTCRETPPPESLDVRALRRLEGASDPSDMLAVVAIVCPNCATAGTLVLNYGPEAMPGDSDLLQSLPDA